MEVSLMLHRTRTALTEPKVSRQSINQSINQSIRIGLFVFYTEARLAVSVETFYLELSSAVKLLLI